MSRTKKLTNDDIPIAVDHDMKYEGMYRLRWADGVVSEDMYNLTRAKDILKNYQLYRQHMAMPNPRSWLDT
jgi:hypothetical protein